MRALLLMLPLSVMAAPLPKANIDNMVKQSEAVMSAGVCQVANDRKAYPGEKIAILLPAPVGLRMIERADYDWIRDAGYKKTKNGEFLMSSRIRLACREADSGRCMAARSLWRQD